MENSMRRQAYRLAHLLLLAMTVSSCTCGTEAPPPPVALPTRQLGFQTTPGSAAAKRTPTVASAPTATSAPLVSATPAVVALPADFPKDIAIMEGSTLAGVQKLGGGAHNVLFNSTADSPQIFNFYKDDLKQKGHEITQQYQTTSQSFLSFKKGNLVTNVVVAKDPKDPKNQVVAIMYYEEQPAEDF